MSVYFTSDLHANHDKIRLYEKRPFKSVQEMQECLTDNWNSVVQHKDDEVYLLGDIWFGSSSGRVEALQRFLQGLNGRKHLILGNHDAFKPFTYLSRGIESVHTNLVYYDPMYFGDIFMCHNPRLYEDRQRKLPKYNLVLCGHVHSLFEKVENIVNVGIDVWGYKPVSLDQILERVKKD
jgi:calcineurin-like phosphoesterase family protein